MTSPKFDPRFGNDYEQVLPDLRALGLPPMARPVYERMRRLFSVKHGYSRARSSWIGPGYHGLLIYGLVRRLRPRVLIDIGTCWGFSALAAALAIADEGSGARVLTVDRARHTDYGRDEFFDRLRRERVVELVGRSQEVLPQLAGGLIDLAFIDGGHSYEDASFDAGFVGHRLGDRGVMVMDDCAPGYEGVTRAAEEAQKSFKLFRRDLWRVRILSRAPLPDLLGPRA